eukprot:87199-Lingulodinium_polyedra.AAC.1
MGDSTREGRRAPLEAQDADGPERRAGRPGDAETGLVGHLLPARPALRSLAGIVHVVALGADRLELLEVVPQLQA